MHAEKGELLCELTGEQFEAALNVARCLQERRDAGSPVDLRGVSAFRVYQHATDRNARMIEIVGPRVHERFSAIGPGVIDRADRAAQPASPAPGPVQPRPRQPG